MTKLKDGIILGVKETVARVWISIKAACWTVFDMQWLLFQINIINVEKRYDSTGLLSDK
jgi:hypothetical protein